MARAEEALKVNATSGSIALPAAKGSKADVIS